MNRITISILTLGFSLAPVLCWAAESKPQTSDNYAAQLKAAQDERVTVLTQLVEALTAQSRTGAAEVAQVFAAENELCKALLDSTDEPEKRIALLTKQLDKMNRLVQMTQALVKAGIVSQADLLRAKSLYLDVKIKLLRERNANRAAAEEKPAISQAIATKPDESLAKAEKGGPEPWKLPNGATMWESRGTFGPPVNKEMYTLIAEKKYKFLKEYEGPNGEKEYVYRFTFSDGSSTATNFSMSLDNVSSWDDYQRNAAEQRQQRHEKISQAIAAGRFRLINLEVMQVHLCRDVATDQKFKVQRIPLGGGKETAFPRADYAVIPPSVKQTAWQEHLQAIREGKRELLDLETTNNYTYEMIADDGTKLIFNYGGNEPLKKLEGAPGKPAATTDLRQELVELKQLASRVSARLDNMERRLSQLEERGRLRGEPTMRMRSLGNHLMVDEHGIIWDGGKPVGVWGINGGEEQPR
jgi:hypothetical protein